VRDHHDGQTGVTAPVREQPDKTALTGGIQSRQRLVEYQYPRRPREQSGQDHAPHLATAELIDGPRRQRGIQADSGQCCDHSGVVVRRKAARRSHFQVDTAAHQLQPGRLELERYCADLVGGEPLVKQTGAGGGNRQPGHDPRQGRLPGAVAAVDQKPVALMHDEADIVERGPRPRGATSVFVAYPCEFEHRRARVVSNRNRWRGGGRGLNHRGVIHRVAEIDCAVGVLSLVVVMGDVDQRGLVMVGETGQHGQQCVPAVLVDHAGDLVGNEQRRLPRQRSGHGEALQLPTRQAAGVAFGEADQPDFIE
jgi:hypothetical protein